MVRLCLLVVVFFSCVVLRLCNIHFAHINWLLLSHKLFSPLKGGVLEPYSFARVEQHLLPLYFLRHMPALGLLLYRAHRCQPSRWALIRSPRVVQPRPTRIHFTCQWPFHSPLLLFHLNISAIPISPHIYTTYHTLHTQHTTPTTNMCNLFSQYCPPHVILTPRPPI